MAYDGNGTFLPLPAPTFPAQPGIVIYAEYFNANLLNIHQGLTAALPRNGEAAMAGPLRMAGFKLTELGAGSSAGEAVEWGQWQNSYLNATYQVLNVPNLGLTPDGTRVTNVNWVDGQFSTRFPNLSAPVLANATEINYLIGLTGDIQSQLSNQVAGPIHVATAKTTPADADELGITDSAASWELKKLTFANLKTWLSGLYAGKTGAGASGTWPISITGNADTATKLATPRAINGVNFDGTANISIAVGDVTLTGTQTLTNKTLTTPLITGTREVRVAMPANDINLGTGNLFTKTISGATTLTVSNTPTTGNAASFILELTNAGIAAITWFSGVKWAGGTAPTLTASGVDVLGFYTHDGGATWRGFLLSKDSK